MGDREISLPTQHGHAVATQHKQGGAWDIVYPWRSEIGHGTAGEIKQRMRDEIRKHEEGEVTP